MDIIDILLFGVWFILIYLAGYAYGRGAGVVQGREEMLEYYEKGQK